MSKNISNFRIVIVYIVVWDEGWFLLSPLEFPPSKALFGMGAIKAQDLSRHVFVVCFVSPFVHSPEPFRSSSIPKNILHCILWIIRYFFLFFDGWYSMAVGFSTYVMTSDFSLFFMSHWNIERSKSFVLSRRKKNCMTQQQPHIVLTILTPFFCIST